MRSASLPMRTVGGDFLNSRIKHYSGSYVYKYRFHSNTMKGKGGLVRSSEWVLFLFRFVTRSVGLRGARASGSSTIKELNNSTTLFANVSIVSVQ